MKKGLLVLLLVLGMLLTACAAQPPQTAASPDASTTTAPQTEPTQPEEEEVTNLFAELYPKDNNVPDKKYMSQVVEELADGIRGHITEVTYTWKNGKVSMEVLGGVRDHYTVLTPPEEDPIQRVTGESEFYNYLLYLPEGYDPDDTETKWPVIFFFHGIGESGDDLEMLTRYGMPKYLLDGGKVDAIMIAPQCPGDSHWADTDAEEEKLVQFVPEMAQKYNIDTNRMYLTGLSMGGRCTWKLALAMPDTFAAIAVVCGRTNTYEFDTINDMPIWMFHGVKDPTVSYDNVNKIVPLLIENDHCYFKLTAYPYGKHDVWTETYAKTELYEWLLSQSLTAKDNG